MSSTTLTASCLCRTCTFTASVPTSKLPLRGLTCHCNSCRHLTGALFNCGVEWPSSLPSSPHLQKFAFSENMNTYFCKTCGTQMFSEPLKPGSSPLCVMSGTLEETEGLVEYEREMFIGDTADGGVSDWIAEVPGYGSMKRWKGMVDASEEVPVGWRASASADKPQQSTVKGSCKCGGVSFHLTRPDAKSADWSMDLRQQKPDYNKPHDAWWLNGANKDKYTTNCCCCRSCRTACGVDFVTWSFVPSHNICPAERGDFSTSFGTLKTYRSSARSEWCFCGTCGAMCFLQLSDRPQIIDVAAGLLRSEDGARAEDWSHWLTHGISFNKEGGKRPLIEALRRGFGIHEKSI